MKKRAGFLSTLIVTALVCFTGTAHATSVDWSTEGGFDNFDTQTILFTGFAADTLDSVVDGIGGTGSWHSHSGNPITATLEVRVDGGWQQIWSDVTTSTSTTAIPPLLSNISFSGGLVDGLRLTASPSVTQAFHAHSGMVYNFSNNAPIPEPSTMLLLGSGLVGLIGYRMKKVQA